MFSLKFELSITYICLSLMTSSVYVWIEIPYYDLLFPYIYTLHDDLRQSLITLIYFAYWISIYWHVYHVHLGCTDLYTYASALFNKIIFMIDYFVLDTLFDQKSNSPTTSSCAYEVLATLPYPLISISLFSFRWVSEIARMSGFFSCKN